MFPSPCERCVLAQRIRGEALGLLPSNLTGEAASGKVLGMGWWLRPGLMSRNEKTGLTTIMQCPQRQLARIMIQVALDEALAFPHEPRAVEPQESCTDHGWSVMRWGSEIRGESSHEGQLRSSDHGPVGRACHFSKVQCHLKSL